jgi:hypothetical protein
MRTRAITSHGMHLFRHIYSKTAKPAKTKAFLHPAQEHEDAGNPNECHLVWQGSVKEPAFKAFSTQVGGGGQGQAWVALIAAATCRLVPGGACLSGLHPSPTPMPGTSLLLGMSRVHSWTSSIHHAVHFAQSCPQSQPTTWADVTRHQIKNHKKHIILHQRRNCC